MRIFRKPYIIPFAVFAFVNLLLVVVQLVFDEKPIILLERFIHGGGWYQIPVISFYGAFIAYKMQDPLNVPKWRKLTWTIFSVFFFTQLFAGLLGAEKFLMTGKLHLPIPVMILAGPLYRGQLSVMTILFLSTIILTGPAWCSHLCYFGAYDNLASSGKTSRESFQNKKLIKATLIFLIILITIILRWLEIPLFTATIIAISFGAAGILIMLFVSRRKGKMVHCILYCPIGTLVNVLSKANPFRICIDNSCNVCMKCTRYCKYDALNIEDIKNRRPGFTCTLCGDCLAACNENSIKYKFLRVKPEAARDMYLFITISLHTVFLALARI